MTDQWNKVVLSIFFWRSTVFASKVWGYMKHAAIFENLKKICNVDLFSQPVVTDMKSIFFFIWNHTVLSLVFHDGMKVHVHVATSIALQEKKIRNSLTHCPLCVRFCNNCMTHQRKQFTVFTCTSFRMIYSFILES